MEKPMRTPNTNCIVCTKALYRRPSELIKYPISCCKGCRSEYYKTKPAPDQFVLGRKKGTNNLSGVPKTDNHKENTRKALREWAANNPEKIKLRGLKSRGDAHYKWAGGISRLNKAVRTLPENRKWARAIKSRDKKCLFCGAGHELQADHIVPLAEIITSEGIKTVEDARACSTLWSIENGRTLCAKCHCQKDGRAYNPTGHGRRYKNRIYH